MCYFFRICFAMMFFIQICVVETGSRERCFTMFVSLTKQVARKLGDENLPRPLGRHSKKKGEKGTAPDVGKPARAKGRQENLNDGVDFDDPQLQDFLQVMQPRVNSKMWANDTSGLTSVGNNQAISNKDDEGASVSTDESSLLEDGFPDISEPSNKSPDPERDEVISDMDYFKSRVTKDWSDSESSDEDDDGSNDNDASSVDNDDKKDNNGVNEVEKNSDPRNDAQEVDLEGKEDTSGEDVTHEKDQVKVTEHRGQLSKTGDEKGVFESCRLFVRNLPYTTTYLYAYIFLFFLFFLLDACVILFWHCFQLHCFPKKECLNQVESSALSKSFSGFCGSLELNTVSICSWF